MGFLLFYFYLLLLYCRRLWLTLFLLCFYRFSLGTAFIRRAFNLLNSQFTFLYSPYLHARRKLIFLHFYFFCFFLFFCRASDGLSLILLTSWLFALICDYINKMFNGACGENRANWDLIVGVKTLNFILSTGLFIFHVELFLLATFCSFYFDSAFDNVGNLFNQFILIFKLLLLGSWNLASLWFLIIFSVILIIIFLSFYFAHFYKSSFSCLHQKSIHRFRPFWYVICWFLFRYLALRYFLTILFRRDKSDLLGSNVFERTIILPVLFTIDSYNPIWLSIICSVKWRCCINQRNRSSGRLSIYQWRPSWRGIIWRGIFWKAIPDWGVHLIIDWWVIPGRSSRLTVVCLSLVQMLWLWNNRMTCVIESDMMFASIGRHRQFLMRGWSSIVIDRMSAIRLWFFHHISASFINLGRLLI